MANAWIVYFLSVVVFIVLLVFVSRRWPLAGLRYAIYGGLVLVLLTPVGVSGTNELAPAWLAAAFEWVFGEREKVAIALKPLSLTAAIYCCVVLLFLLRFFRKKSSVESEVGST